MRLRFGGGFECFFGNAWLIFNSVLKLLNAHRNPRWKSGLALHFVDEGRDQISTT
jgi:hypothetical protein